QEPIDARHATVDCGPLPRVRGSREQLEDLFEQLLDNALKFQPGDKPVVSIAAKVVEGRCEIRVSPRGTGREAAPLARIFKPFQRLHPPDSFPGTGIGLAICSKIV